MHSVEPYMVSELDLRLASDQSKRENVISSGIHITLEIKNTNLSGKKAIYQKYTQSLFCIPLYPHFINVYIFITQSC